MSKRNANARAKYLAILAFRRNDVWFRDRIGTGANARVKCAYCPKLLARKIFTIDHVIPQSRGGSHALENLVAACAKCNEQKGSEII